MVSPVDVGQRWHLQILARNVIARLLNAATWPGVRIPLDICNGGKLGVMSAHSSAARLKVATQQNLALTMHVVLWTRPSGSINGQPFSPESPTSAKTLASGSSPTSDTNRSRAAPQHGLSLGLNSSPAGTVHRRSSGPCSYRPRTVPDPGERRPALWESVLAGRA